MSKEYQGHLTETFQELEHLSWKMYCILKKSGYTDALAKEYMCISTELIIGGIFDVRGR